MRYVTFYPQIAAEALTEPHYVISIVDKIPAVFQCHHHSVLRLVFDDIEQFAEGQNLFSISQARSIMSWVKDVPEGATVVVHCYAGVSRSAAIAKFLHEHCGFMLLLAYPCHGSLKQYNGHVFGLLRLLSADMNALRLMLDEEYERQAVIVRW
jgi:rhodanese-related sulfurtransferase